MTQQALQNGAAASNQVANPFAKPRDNQHVVASAGSDQERAIQEVQASLIIAKKFPRDTTKAMDNILKECMRPSLAESAEYAFPRGNQTVTGPSIRLAESIARCWGNMDYGIRELEQSDGESQVEAYAWDMETNTRARRVFTVKHIRHTRSGQYALKDPRDIYEMAANQGARRMRACILELIPGDVVDTALKQVSVTLKANIDVTPEALKKMIEAFSTYGVTEEHISKRFGKSLTALLPAEFVNLKQIYAGLRDGMSKPKDWFDTGEVDQTQKQEETAAADSAIETAPDNPDLAAVISSLRGAADRQNLDLILADSEMYEFSEDQKAQVSAVHAECINALSSKLEMDV